MKTKVTHKHYILNYRFISHSDNIDYPVETRFFYNYSDLKAFMSQYAGDYEYISIIENVQNIYTKVL